MLNWLIIYLFTNIITYKRNDIIQNKPLIDIIHSNSYLNKIDIDKKICDLFPLLCIFLVNNYNKFIKCHSYLILLRFICFHATILPPPMKLNNRLSFGIIPNFTYDLIFSGHTMTCVLSIFCVNKDQIPYCLILSLLCSISVVISKEHYTVDVIIAWLATYCIVSLYSININKLLES
jgi:hypothetical protein